MSEKKQFRAESQRLLDMMIHSIYTHKEIFLREIISNASDAIDKRVFLSLTDSSAGLPREDYAITLTLDKENRILTVSDNGIGMSPEELENNLGVIASSGSLRFRREHQQEKTDTELIGQFGVGFYSAFMVADRIRVISRKAGSPQGACWESDGVDGYAVTPCEKEAVGTDVIMHIQEDGEEKDEFSQYLREYPIWKLVKKYSDYIRFPIRMRMPRPVLKEGSTPENPEYEEVFEYETLNSMVPIWQRRRSEVTREEQEKFYQEYFADPNPPQSVISVAAEGTVSYKALLFIPSAKPMRQEEKYGLQLFSAGVKIMERCEALLPEYLNFVRGVVDSPDLSLNISRELLQHDRQLKIIAANLEKKLRAELDRMLRDDREGYERFYANFGRGIKLCAMDDYGAKKEQLQDYLLFHSSTRQGYVTLKEYVDGMQPEQKYIYYAAGPSVEAIDRLPQTEVLKDHNLEILYFTDKADEFIPDILKAYGGKPFRSATDGDPELPGEDKDKYKKYNGTFAFIKEALGDRVDEVKATAKLKSHPVCISSGQGVTFEMERYFTATHPERGIKAKRILELNVEHRAFRALERARMTDPEKAKKMTEILLQQALMIAGMPVEDPSAYTDLICSLW